MLYIQNSFLTRNCDNIIVTMLFNFAFQMFADSLSDRVQLAEDSDIFICFLGSELERLLNILAI